MARTTRKRNPAPAPAPTAVEPTTETTQTDETTDPVANLTAAYWNAIDARDTVTGTIPAAPLDAVKVAYRAIERRRRGDVATRLGAEASAKMVGPDGTVDAGMAVAMGRLAALFAEVNDERRTRERPPHDPVPDVAGLLAALDHMRADMLGQLTDDQRTLVDQHEPDDQSMATEQKAIARLAPIVNRALNGSKRRGTGEGRNGAPARNLADLVTEAVAGNDQPVMLATIAREHEVSTGALGNRWAKDNIPGVSCVEHDGRKAFAAA